MSMMNAAAVDAATETALEMGIRVFNGALFGEDEAEHVDVLLAILDPVEDALIIDAGCGVGEMARLMHERRPDLKFLLVNTSQAQLEHCPPEFDRLLADYEHLDGVPDHCADAIVFSYSLCHAEYWPSVLAEARRVLKPGGTLLVNDMATLATGTPDEMERLLGARVWPPELVESWFREAGFMLDEALAPDVGVNRLGELLERDGIDPAVLGDIIPTVWRLTALDDEAAMWSANAGKIAFQFSGGRDSTAALYLLRDRWPEITCVYHVDTGDQFPETRAVVDRVRADLEEAGVRFVVITTDVQAQRERDGYPTDLIPVNNTALGRMVSGQELLLTGRFDCCANALMLPLHNRMHDDDMRLLIRGQRDDEYSGGAPTRDRDEIDGFQVHYPVQGWTAHQVQEYLEEHGLPLAPFYQAGMKRAPECMGCTAWWDEGRLEYMREHHPAARKVVLLKLDQISAAISAQFNQMED